MFAYGIDVFDICLVASRWTSTCVPRLVLEYHDALTLSGFNAAL